MKGKAVVWIVPSDVGKKRAVSAAWMDKYKKSFFINVEGHPGFEIVFEGRALKQLRKELNE